MESSFSRLNIANHQTNPTLPNLDDSRSFNHNSNATIDGLSVELKIAILQYLSDTRSLRALIRSSPLYYKAYADQRQGILSTVLLRDLGPEVFLEAISLHEASKIPWWDVYTPSRRAARKESVEALIARYKAQRETRPPFSQSTLDLKILESIVRFQD